MTILEAMTEFYPESEVIVFRKFFFKSISLQKQPDTTYHTDQLLRDRMLTAFNVP